MVTNYGFVIGNRTGQQQSYGIIAARSVVSAEASGPVRGTVIASSIKIPNGANFGTSATNDYYAICGTYTGDPAQKAILNILSSFPITVGTKVATGLAKGSTIPVEVPATKNGCMLRNPVSPGQGVLGSFQLTTGDNFTIQDSRNNGLFVGVAYSLGTSPNKELIPLSTFSFNPSSSYQTQPVPTFYVVVGDFPDRGAVVEIEQFSKTIAIDFVLRGTSSVTVTHDAQGQLVFA